MSSYRGVTKTFLKSIVMEAKEAAWLAWKHLDPYYNKANEANRRNKFEEWWVTIKK